MIARLLPNRSMIAALGARRSHRELADHLELFGQFVGSWEVDIRNYPADAPAWRVDGEWHFGWVLEGRAIQDVWIAPKRALRGGAEAAISEFGTTVRFYDPRLGAWRSTWHGPMRGVVRCFIARPVGSEIVLEGSFEPGLANRWTFSRITPDSFHWRSVESRDGWATERLTQEMFATRTRTAGPWPGLAGGPPRLPFRGIL